jgi:hypothetical protein
MSVSLEAIKERRPGMSDDEAIRDFARESGFHAVVTFLDRGGRRSVKGAIYDEELEEVQSSPYVSDVVVVYNDGALRSQRRESASQAAYAQQRLAEEFAKSQPAVQKDRGKRWWQFWK